MIVSTLTNWSLVPCKVRRCVYDSYVKLCSVYRCVFFLLYLAIKEDNLFILSVLAFSAVFSEGPQLQGPKFQHRDLNCLCHSVIVFYCTYNIPVERKERLQR